MSGEAQTEVKVDTAHRTPFGFEPVSVEDVLSNVGSSPYLHKNAIHVYDAYGEAAKAAENNPDRLFNYNPPCQALLHEQPIHRLAALLKARGASTREIAAQCNWTPEWTRQVSKQPWFQERVLALLNEAGQDQLSAIFKSEAVNSAFTLVELRDNEKAPPAVRKAAADSLLDRFLGKPTAKLELDDQRLPSTEQTRAIDTEIAAIDAQLETQPTNETPSPTS